MLLGYFGEISHSLGDKSGLMEIFSGQDDLLDRMLTTSIALLSLTKICLDQSRLVTSP